MCVVSCKADPGGVLYAVNNVLAGVLDTVDDVAQRSRRCSRTTR